MCDELSAIILAGGFSSRMGQDKAALPLEGTTFLQYMTDKLRAIGIAEIIVSGWKDCPIGTTYVPDLYPHRGPLSGIHAGLLAVQNHSALVIPVDMPLISEKTLLALAHAHGEKAITVLESEPMPGIFDTKLAPLCEELLHGQNHSLHRLFGAAGAKRISDPDSPFRRMNCNRPEEYKTVQQYFAAQVFRTNETDEYK